MKYSVRGCEPPNGIPDWQARRVVGLGDRLDAPHVARIEYPGVTILHPTSIDVPCLCFKPASFFQPSNLMDAKHATERYSTPIPDIELTEQQDDAIFFWATRKSMPTRPSKRSVDASLTQATAPSPPPPHLGRDLSPRPEFETYNPSSRH